MFRGVPRVASSRSVVSEYSDHILEHQLAFWNFFRTLPVSMILTLCRWLSFQTTIRSLFLPRSSHLRLSVSGTEKQHVTDDYIQRLSEGTDSCQEAVNDAFTYVWRHQKAVQAIPCLPGGIYLGLTAICIILPCKLCTLSPLMYGVLR